MTSQQAFCSAVFAGLVPTAPFDAGLISRLAWWDETCQLVLLATEALAELGRPRTVIELGKCFVAEGYTLGEAAAMAAEVCAHPRWQVEHCAAWLREQMGAAA
jgi:hypothetical protein